MTDVCIKKIGDTVFDILETIFDPEAIYEDKYGAFIATRKIEKDKYIAVVYKELNQDEGFIITAFLTKRIQQISRRKIIWP